MTPATRALYSTRCAICRGPIAKGDTIVLYEDHPCHEDCVPDYEPWSDKPTKAPPPIRALIELLTEQGTLSARMMEGEFDAFSLPPAVQKAFWDYIAAEGNLWTLVRDVASEHVVVE